MPTSGLVFPLPARPGPGRTVDNLLRHRPAIAGRDIRTARHPDECDPATADDRSPWQRPQPPAPTVWIWQTVVRERPTGYRNRAATGPRARTLRRPGRC